MTTVTADQAAAMAAAHYQAGRFHEAEAIYRQILQFHPNHPELLHRIALIATQTGRPDQAVELLQRALQVSPDNPTCNAFLGDVLQKANRPDEALAFAQKAIDLQPDFIGAWFTKALSLRGLGRLDEAILAFRRIIEIQPTFDAAFLYLGLLYARTARHEEAAAAFGELATLQPNSFDAHNNRGNSLLESGWVDEAIASYKRAIEINPRSSAALSNLGLALSKKQRHAEAVKALTDALAFGDPKETLLHFNLANTLADAGSLGKAMDAYRRALQRSPDSAVIHDRFARVLLEDGQAEEALALWKRAMELQPDSPQFHQRYANALNYAPGRDGATISREHSRWVQEHLSDIEPNPDPFPNVRSPSRTLRIGFLSPDFRDPAIAYFIEPILGELDRRRFNIYCYCNAAAPEKKAVQPKVAAARWRDISTLSDADAAAMIRADQIDILIDLAGHSEGNRLPVLARKPAPLQAAWLGYPSTTGLPAIDYWITDAQADPLGLMNTFYTEELLILPSVGWCYRPGQTPPVQNPPAMQRGYITFGSFNEPARINTDVLKLWSRVLASVPQSRLALKGRAFADPDGPSRWRKRLADCGIAPERVDLLPPDADRQRHMNSHRLIDVALDTYPYNGALATCDALWMGVPVVTLAGRVHASRIGVSLLLATNLPEMIAKTPEEYVAIAVKVANELPRLRALRSQIPQYMETCPLMDAIHFVRDAERAFRAMWRIWCEGKKTGPK